MLVIIVALTEQHMRTVVGYSLGEMKALLIGRNGGLGQRQAMIRTGQGR